MANLANETWGNRLLRTSIYLADMMPFLLFSSLSALTAWVQAAEQLPADVEQSWSSRQLNRFRRGLLAVFRLFVDLSVVQNQNVDEMFMNRFNLGILFTLLFACELRKPFVTWLVSVKFASIWFVVLYFPQYTDTKGVVMLTMLTVVFILYTFYNRPQQNRAEVRAFQ